jgi:uncharacterized integral membrane protein
MTKLRIFLLLLVGVFLTLFAKDNWYYPPLKFLKFEFFPLPLSLLIYGCLLLGFLSGWVAHALKVRRKKLTAPADKVSTPE